MRDVSQTAGLRLGSSLLLGIIVTVIARVLSLLSGPLAKRYNLQPEELDRWMLLMVVGAAVILAIGLAMIWAPYVIDARRRNRH